MIRIKQDELSRVQESSFGSSWWNSCWNINNAHFKVNNIGFEVRKACHTVWANLRQQNGSPFQLSLFPSCTWTPGSKGIYLLLGKDVKQMNHTLGSNYQRCWDNNFKGTFWGGCWVLSLLACWGSLLFLFPAAFVENWEQFVLGSGSQKAISTLLSALICQVK